MSSFTNRTMQLGLSIDRVGRVFAQPAIDPYKIGWVVFQPATNL